MTTYAKLAAAMLAALKGDEMALSEVPKVWGASEMLRDIRDGKLAVVPVEPTEEMRRVVVSMCENPDDPNYLGEPPDDGHGEEMWHTECYKKLCRAMLKAAGESP